MVNNTTTGKPRGFAFVEFEHERDMHCKYRTIYNNNCSILTQVCEKPVVYYTAS